MERADRQNPVKKDKKDHFDALMRHMVSSEFLNIANGLLFDDEAFLADLAKHLGLSMDTMNGADERMEQFKACTFNTARNYIFDTLVLKHFYRLFGEYRNCLLDDYWQEQTAQSGLFDGILQ